MMSTLFDYETIMKNHDATIRREATEKATEKANERAIANIVTIYKQIDGSKNAAIQNVVAMYGYSEEDATTIVQKYWEETPVTINIPVPKED